ncbi:MAG: hypothetical protein GC189_13820 [Alphaproteobacteria bacterium]|nr:hypothetical protein [Alphaproteobacteria bacterium]
MSFEDRYSFVDKVLHRLAFATPKLQIDFAGMEDERFFKGAAPVVDRPVFITAMPRAGTTLLLNVLSESGVFATHTYRDMPFLFTPVGWRGFSGRFRREDTPRERAHGDGMMVSIDSPEAFEEMLWKAFWPGQYQADHIASWPSDGGDAFRDFFSRHMAKIAALAGQGRPRARRYASKNNFNIARIGWLRRAYRDARIIVPFREPIEHAASLLRQHVRFLEMHKTDAFMREYMMGIGHFDFGAGLKPIDFDGWRAGASQDATTLGFWLAYWRAAYGHCLRENAGEAAFFDYDAFCAAPQAGLSALARAADEPSLALALSEIRAPRLHEPDVSSVDAALLQACADVHARLKAAGVGVR